MVVVAVGEVYIQDGTFAWSTDTDDSPALVKLDTHAFAT